MVENIGNSEKLFDVSLFEFPEFLFTSLGSDGMLPFWAKCAGFFALLYGMGIVTNLVSDTLLPGAGTRVEMSYLNDYSFLVVSVAAACTLIFLLSALRKLDRTLIQLNRRIGTISTSADGKKFVELVSWMRQWMPMGERFLEKPFFWYYLETIGGATLGALFAIYWSVYSTALFWGRVQYGVSSLYFISFCAIIGYMIGAVIFATIGSVKAIRRYCKDFITPERVLALNPDKVGGLRPIGQFSLGLDVAFALPSFVVFSYLAQGVSVTDPLVAMTLLFYTFILVVVFFIPLSAAHDSMLTAKERAYDQVNEIFKETNSKISTGEKKSNFRQIKALKDVYFLHEKVSKMAVWPLNLSIVIKFIITSSFPIVGSFVVTLVSNYLGI